MIKALQSWPVIDASLWLRSCPTVSDLDHLIKGTSQLGNGPNTQNHFDSSDADSW
jgi:hypothetical protein